MFQLLAFLLGLATAHLGPALKPADSIGGPLATPTAADSIGGPLTAAPSAPVAPADSIGGPLS
ncbi:MAG: hypothetical protein ACYDA5_10785 [Vulcanimicrobiaceae bacterium]